MSREELNKPEAPAPQDPADGKRGARNRLSAAFARLMGVSAGEEAEQNENDPVTADVNPDIVTPRMIVEGLLFVGRSDGRPLTSTELAAPIRDVAPGEVEQLIDELNEKTSIMVEPWDESGSTQKAYRRKKKDDMLDARAAAVILQEFLDEAEP